MIFKNIPPVIVPHLATISAADRLILPSFEKKYGKSDPASIVRFFIWICLREINMGWARLGSSGLGSTAMVSAGLGCAGLGSTWIDSFALCLAGLGWARLEQNRLEPTWLGCARLGWGLAGLG